MPVKLPIRLLTADDPGFDPTQLPFMGGFNPLSLFANGEQGAWYDPSDLTTLYQDSAGTTPVTTDGDPVGLMLDKSGNGNDASQSTTSAKPIYRTDGTLHWLEFNGTKFMITATLASHVFTVNSGLFAVGADSNDAEGLGGVIEEVSASPSNRVALLADTRVTPNRLLTHAPQGTSAFADRLAEWDGSTQVMIGAASAGPVITGYIDGVETGSGTPLDSFTDSTTLTIGKQTVGDFFFSGNFYGAIARSTESSATDIANITRYLARKSGVTL